MYSVSDLLALKFILSWIGEPLMFLLPRLPWPHARAPKGGRGHACVHWSVVSRLLLSLICRLTRSDSAGDGSTPLRGCPGRTPGRQLEGACISPMVCIRELSLLYVLRA